MLQGTPTPPAGRATRRVQLGHRQRGMDHRHSAAQRHLRPPAATSSQDGDTTLMENTVMLDPAAGR